MVARTFTRSGSTASASARRARIWSRTGAIRGSSPTSTQSAFTSFQTQNFARYFRFSFEATVDADVGTPYSWEFSLPARYFQREHGNVGNNSTVILTAEAFLDDILDYPFETTVVNTLAGADL